MSGNGELISDGNTIITADVWSAKDGKQCNIFIDAALTESNGSGHGKVFLGIYQQFQD